MEIVSIYSTPYAKRLLHVVMVAIVNTNLMMGRYVMTNPEKTITQRYLRIFVICLFLSMHLVLIPREYVTLLVSNSFHY
jgi:hypothetical protein